MGGNVWGKCVGEMCGGNGKRIDNYRKKVTDLYWTT